MPNERQLLQYAKLLNARRRALGLQAVSTNDLQSRPSNIIITDHNWSKSLPVAVRFASNATQDNIRQSAELEAHALRILRQMK